MINYNNKKFKSIANSASGEVDGETIFHYFQKGNVLWATYNGGSIKFGTMTGLVHENGSLTFAYQHVNTANEIMTGTCESVPEQSEGGKLRLIERWSWTCKDKSSGESLIEEI